jgi:hypothetical protein
MNHQGTKGTKAAGLVCLCVLRGFEVSNVPFGPVKELSMPTIRSLRPAIFLVLFAHPAFAQEKLPRVAVVTTVWRHNSHADVIASRLVQGNTLDGQGEFPRLKLVSAYVDQFPANDMSRRLAKEHGFTLYDTVARALTLGGDKLAVDGVLLICEHGEYPRSASGSIEYPKRRLFGEIIQVFERLNRVVPVFSDKHFEDDWADIDWFYREAQRLKIPLMAGSSLPTLWRYPEADVERGRPVKEIVATSYGGFDAYGFHALEVVQCLAEQRKQGDAWGETGVKQVRCLEGDAVWQAARDGLFDRKLLDEAITRLQKPLPEGKTIEQVGKPTLYVVDYRDGLRASILWASPINEWTVAWRYADGQTQSTCFWTQEGRPYMHFTYLLKGAEQMIHTGQPAWPAERTLLTSGVLDAVLQSRSRGGEIIATPHLGIAYQPKWRWQMPPPPPPTRPSAGQ